MSWRRTRMGLAAALLVLAVACTRGGEPTPAPAAPTATTAATATTTPTGSPAPPTVTAVATAVITTAPAIPVTAYAQAPLAELAPEAAAFLAGRPGVATVGVVVPDRATIYVANPETAVQTASVIKAAIMMDVIARARAEGRAVSADELALLEPMITRSDNDSATALWNLVGGGAGLSEYLAGIGVAGITPNPADCWGASKATGPGVATLLGRLAFDDVLAPADRALALDLLARVDPEQRWGATAGTPEETPDGTVIGVKDGWYPAECGWWAGSTAIVLPGPTAPPGASAYAIAVLTAQHATLEDAVATIEGVATAVHDALHGQIQGTTAHAD